jgi:hypothetical protein
LKKLKCLKNTSSSNLYYAIIPAAVALMALVFLAGPVFAQHAEKSASPHNAASSEDKGGNFFSGEDILRLAETWANAVKNRDGRTQYALMTKALQQSVYDEFTELNWVTGTSSPWVESFMVKVKNGGASVIFRYETSTGPAGSYKHDLTFAREDGELKISWISEPVKVGDPSTTSSDDASLELDDLIYLIGKTKDELSFIMGGPGTPVDEGGLGFEEVGVRVWFDVETHTKVAQVLVMNDEIDLNGLRLGDLFSEYERVFGRPLSDINGDAHFRYGEYYLSVVRNMETDRAVAVYVLAENF